MEIKIRLPRIAAGALSNLVGLLGLLAIATAVGALAGDWWWSVLVTGVFGVALAALAQIAEQQVAAAPKVGAAPSRPVPVPKAADA
ncbi:MAG: hypothetical protein JWP48_813 [Actinoallomurus sp.]|nr:hypothetical protein [Actinoallomurus sp.]